MDVLSAYQARGRASLEHMALLLGLPGKLGMSGDQVFEYWREPAGSPRSAPTAKRTC